MFSQVVYSPFDRSRIVNALAGFRAECEQASEDKSLIETPASVGLILGDIVMMLGLDSKEQEAVLGKGLRREFMQVLRTRNGNG